MTSNIDQFKYHSNIKSLIKCSRTTCSREISIARLPFRPIKIPRKQTSFYIFTVFYCEFIKMYVQVSSRRKQRKTEKKPVNFDSKEYYRFVVEHQSQRINCDSQIIHYRFVKRLFLPFPFALIFFRSDVLSNWPRARARARANLFPKDTQRSWVASWFAQSVRTAIPDSKRNALRACYFARALAPGFWYQPPERFRGNLSKWKSSVTAKGSPFFSRASLPRNVSSPR